MGELKDFSFAIRDIKRDYAYKYHAKYKLSGPIWRERFKSLLIENEEYLYACGKYIEENPLKAKIVKDVNEWDYGSGRRNDLKSEDELIDKYEKDIRKEEISINETDFENGNVIGSDFFKFQFSKSCRREQTCPQE
jgi:hypothetical protein